MGERMRNLYAVPLALVLSVQNARAQEPKECIDKIILEIRIDKINNDPFSSMYYSQSKRKRGELQEKLAETARVLYEQGLHIPVTVCKARQCDGVGEAIHVRYTPRSTAGGLFPNDFNFREQLSLAFAEGMTIRTTNDIYLFPVFTDDAKKVDLTQHIGIVLAHEIGHVLGLEHPERDSDYSNGKRDVMSSMRLEGEEVILGDEDKQKILSQVCKPKKQQ